MQKYHLLLLLSFGIATMHAQWGEYFNFSEMLACPYDSTSQVEWPSGWQVYHTKNNQWDGEIDSSWCISVELVVQGFNRSMYLNAEEIDGERPVFFRSTQFPKYPVMLPPDMLYGFQSSVETLNDATLRIGNVYPPLSGTLISVDIPAEDFIERDERIRFYEFPDSVGWIYLENCFASEKFIDQSVKEIVIALSVRHSQSKGRIIKLNSVSLGQVYDFDILTQHEIPSGWWADTSYIIPLSELGSMPYDAFNYLLPYTSMAYPSSAHFSYYDLQPEVSSDTAQTITVEIYEYMSLIPQPFTAFRGGLVSVTDTIRHRVELLNNGGNLCIWWIGDLVFNDHTKYTHKAGTIDLHSDVGCMMFKSGATMELAEDAELDYGKPGIGFLAMKQGSNLVLRKNASLTIKNTLVIQLSPTNDHTHPTVHLYPGSKLQFSEDANLEAWGSDDLRLRIIMLGGSLNTDALSSAERALIEIEYPKSPAHRSQNDIFLVNDEINQQLRIYLNNESAFSVTLMISDAMGRLVLSENFHALAGNYYHVVDLGNLPDGWYVASLQTPQLLHSKPFIQVR